VSDNRSFGAVGSKMLFENDRVRVWELTLQPGEESPVHRHDHDHLLIQVAGDRIAVVPEPDTQSRYKDYLEADVRTGDVAFVRRGGIETARNVGSEPYREIIVELK
jgi:predicted metal-dependent enzyme (double-stranded beta helix superfamily)